VAAVPLFWGKAIKMRLNGGDDLLKIADSTSYLAANQ